MQVDDLIPQSGFFRDYFSWVRRLTDAPEVFHVGAALAAVSATIGGRAKGWFPVKLDGQDAVSTFPTNLWTLMIGPSGDRKSTACDYAVEVCEPAIGGYSMIQGSPEAAFDIVANQPDVFFYHGEGATLFAQLRADYWISGQGLLCSLYDGRDTTRTLSGKRDKTSNKPTQPYKVQIKKPRITMLIGIAPALLEGARQSDWSGGFIGRMLVLYGERLRYSEAPALRDDGGLVKLQSDLVTLRSELEKVGVMPVGVKQDAWDLYAKWAKKIDSETKHRPAKIMPLLQRLPMHILRTSACYALSQYYDTITVDSMVPALALGEYSRGSIERIADLLADDVAMRNAVKVRDMLRQSPGHMLTIAEITESMRVSWHTLDPALKTLLTSGRIRIALDPENPEAKIVKLIS